MFVFSVFRFGDTSVETTVHVRTEQNTADPGTDYEHRTETLTFAPNEFEKSFEVVVYGDLEVEEDEYFSVVLYDASGSAVIDVAVATGTIINDDVQPAELQLVPLT